MTQMNPQPMPSDYNLPAEPPTWPKVVGIISIVLASLGLVCGVCGGASLLFMPQMMKSVEQQMGEPMPGAMMPGIGQIVITFIGIPVAVLLLFAGILTLKRSMTGRTLHFAWAALSILLTIIALYLGYDAIQKQVAWKAANSGSKWAGQMNPAFGYIGMCVSGVIGLAYPLFVLVWFGALKKTHKDMTGGFEQEPVV